MNKRNIKLIIFIASITMTFSGTLFAEDTILNLNGAINISLENNNKYKIVHEKVNEKRQKVIEVWGELWPEFSSGVSRTWWNAEKGIYSDSDGQTDVQLVKGTFAINPGMFYGRLKASREEHIITVNDERRIKSETTVNTIQLYYKVLLVQDMVSLRTDSVKALEENFRVVEAAYQEGTLTKLVYLRAQVALANEKTMLINAKKDLKRAKAGFNIQMGRDIDAPVNLDASSLVLSSSGDKALVDMPENDRMNSFVGLTEIAIKNRPELMMLQHKKALYKSKETESDSVYMWPVFFITGSYGMSKLDNPVTNIRTGYPDPTLDLAINAVNSKLNSEGWNKNWNFTIGATYRWGALSPLDATGPRSRELKSLSTQTDMEIEDFVRNVKLEIQDGLLELEAASNSYNSQKENLKSAEESLRVAALQFKNGMIDNTILLNANVELSSARAMYVQSLYDFQAAKARLNQSLGFELYAF